MKFIKAFIKLIESLIVITFQHIPPGKNNVRKFWKSITYLLLLTYIIIIKLLNLETFLTMRIVDCLIGNFMH